MGDCNMSEMNGQNVGAPVAAVGTTISKQQLDQIIEEIARYEVNLEADPTQPHLGTRYLQQVISRCRLYQNRVQYYLQIVKLHEKKIRLDLRNRELDLDFKMKEKLADDAIVRKQPSVRDREALATTLLKEEHDVVAGLKIELIDVEETIKLIRSKYEQLKQTSNDIRMQRVLIKDDKDAQLLGGDGYTKPQASQKRIVEGGLPAPVELKRVLPEDLLAGTSQVDMPKPVDAEHATMMADFLNAHPVQVPPWICGTCQEPVRIADGYPLACPKGHRGICAQCGEPQIYTLSGQTCKNGHGGAETVMGGEIVAEVEPEPESPTIKPVLSYSDLLDT